MKIHITAKTVWDADGNESKISDGGCRITSLPKSGVQRINVKTLQEHSAFATLIKDGSQPRIVYVTKDGDVTFLIKHMPGRYCLTCDERLPDFAGGGTVEEAKAAKQCRKHVDDHGGKAETSARWPHGYQSYPNSYECTIEETDLTKRLMRAGA